MCSRLSDMDGGSAWKLHITTESSESTGEVTGVQEER